jgi:hypothetical protein
MRINRFLFVTMIASAVCSPFARSTDVEPVDHIVSSNVVSDEVVSGDANSGDSYSSDMGSCPDGSACAAGSACANGTCANRTGANRMGQNGMGGVGGLRGALGSYIGDLARCGHAGDMDSGCQPRTYGYPDLFYNYYTQGNCNSTNAQMYTSPIPVPPNVGQTYITYQPFMPHEMLYWHKDRFHNYYDGGRGMNHTKVHYFAPPVRTAASNVYWNYLRIPR